MGAYANLIQAVSSAGQLGATAYGLANQPPVPAVPKPTMPDYSQVARATLPGARANAAANVGGGISPEFLAGLVGSESGSAQGALDILAEIRRSLGPGQAP